MKQSMFKRVLPLAMAALLLFAAGCGKAPVQDKAEEVAPEPVTIGGEADETNTANVDHSSLYSVDGTTEESNGESYASDTANVNTILVEKLGVLTMTSADINKTGDSAGDFSGGQNAALAVLSGGVLTLDESNITSNAKGAFGMFVGGDGSSVTVNGTSVYTSGEESPALALRDGPPFPVKPIQPFNRPKVLCHIGVVPVVLPGRHMRFACLLDGSVRQDGDA